MSATVAEWVEAEFGIEVAGGPERFKKSGWFPVGLTEADCPRCRSQMQGYRMPYTTKAGLTYHYWALACLECKRLFEPENLDEGSRQLLYKNSEYRPTPAGDGGSTAKLLAEEGGDEPQGFADKKDEVSLVTTGKSNIPPSRKLAEKIIARLVSEKLLTEQLGKQLLPKLAEGQMQPDDWRLPIELSDPEED